MVGSSADLNSLSSRGNESRWLPGSPAAAVEIGAGGEAIRTVFGLGGDRGRESRQRL
jgi:hypothetical protein